MHGDDNEFLYLYNEVMGHKHHLAESLYPNYGNTIGKIPKKFVHGEAKLNIVLDYSSIDLLLVYAH